jgi:hypothetical protein
MKWPMFAVVFVAGLIHTACLLGQFYSTGESPASIKWSRITTPHFKIIYTKGLNDEANLLANKLEYFMPLSMGDFEHPMKKKFPVLLHTTSVLSNGYVTLAPKRMEIVTTPPQDSYAQDWITQLTLHEFRHVVQLNRLDQGFTSALGWLTGEIAAGIVSSQIPAWFYEGDAVSNETRLSESGRGRIPGFEMPLRALLLEHPDTYSYDKAVFGSYRDYVPDHYRYGYQIVSYARSLFGEDSWYKAFDYTSRHPFLIWPLALYLKKNYGIYKSGLYKQTIDSLKQQYNNQQGVTTYRDYASLNCRTNLIYTSYILPKDMGNGKTLALRTGLSDPGSFVVIDSTGRVEKVFVTGRSMQLKCDLFENLLIWDEVVSDPRWGKRDYSEIRLADLKTGKRRSLTRKTRYFSPDFSPDGNRIAVAETDNRNRHYLTIIDVHTGKCIRQIPAAENRAIQFPEWISQNEIAVITVSEKGKQLEMVDLENEMWTVKLPFTRYDISEIFNYKNYILFRSSFNKIENIYAISKANGAIFYQVTFSQYGAYHPSVTKDSLKLLFSNYGSAGFDAASLALDSSYWVQITANPNPPARWNNPIRTIGAGSYDSFPRVSYSAKPYKKYGHLFNIHSWLPFYTDLNDFTGKIGELPFHPGVMLYSQNLLSTVISSLGYSYDQGYHKFIPSLRWSGWYPVFELSGQLGGPQGTLPLPDGIRRPEDVSPYYEISLKTYIPLTYNRGSYITLVQPMAEFNQSGIWYYSEGDLKKGIDFFHLKISVNHYLRFSQRDIYPRWGQFLSAAYTQTPAEKNQFGNMFSIQGVAFFPGFTKHHNFYIKGGLQVQRPEKYFIPVNRIDFPRGYNTAVSRKFTSLMLNYSFPAGYPDLSLGPLLYVKRFRVNIFHDWSYGMAVREYNDSEVVNYTGVYRSFGTEILADMHFIRLIFPVSAGVRLGYIPVKHKYFSEFLLNIDTGIF